MTRDGATVRALEALANRQAEVGLLYRPPTRAEQEIVVSAVGDSVVCFPIALGGIALLANASSSVASLEMEDLRRFLRGERDPRFERLYAPDPNQGLWDAFRYALGFAVDDAVPDSTRFLVDEAAVLQAVAADPRGLGIGSTMTLPDSAGLEAVRMVPVQAQPGSPAVRPGYEQIGYGEYPLYHYLYAGCLKSGSVRGAMFVTFLTSDRCQRQVEREGYLPARQTMRKIVLTRNPLGSSN